MRFQLDMCTIVCTNQFSQKVKLMNMGRAYNKIQKETGSSGAIFAKRTPEH